MRIVYSSVALALVFAMTMPLQAQTPPVVTAPADWAQVPRGFMLTQFKNLWSVKQGKRFGGFFLQAIVPVPTGLVAAGLSQMYKAMGQPSGKKKNAKKRVLTMKVTQSRVCGASANVTTINTGKKSTDAVIEATVYSVKALTYASLLVRPASLPPAAIESAIRSACPLANGDLPQATPPSGWAPILSGLDLEFDGLWLGNSPMQMMWLLKGHQIPDPEMLAGMLKPMVTHQAGKAQVQSRIDLKHMTFCGRPGILVNTQAVVPPGFGLSYDLSAVKGSDATYILSYFHPTSLNDPGAQQALTSLCGGPPPTSSPIPAPAKT